MSKSKNFDLICRVGAVVMAVIAALTVLGAPLMTAQATELPYTKKIFDNSYVHKIDIVADEKDWQSMLDNAAREEYISCTVVIDGEKLSTVGIRPKGNTSLSTVAASDSDRYSFKIEFDQFVAGKSYYGLDKLCLNNAIQDATYMKDFLCYNMMDFIGADAPLASFAYLTVNGEEWGLYTAVEAVEDSFAQRNYGASHGQIYKPDSMDMGGGGKGAEFRNIDMGGDFADRANFLKDLADRAADGDMSFIKNGRGDGMPGGMGRGSEDVLLVYSDDDPSSYPNIFENAVFKDVTEEDESRLISSIKALNEGNIEGAVNIDEVLRYFAAHNFVINSDSYTGMIIHNYYLYEKDGVMSMIPWDYNLAFGGMGGGQAESAVNSPIDSPVTSGDISQRPMASWIFSDGKYTEEYHRIMDEFIAEYFESGHFESMIDSVTDMISPYVQKDPTAFYTYDEFTKGAQTLKEFCLLRAESVRKQLSGDIPSTKEGQSEDKTGFVGASSIQLSDMGSQNNGPGGGKMLQGFTPPQGGEGMPDFAPGEMPDGENMPQMPEMPQGGEFPQNDEMPQLPDGFGDLNGFGGFNGFGGEQPQQPNENEAPEESAPEKPSEQPQKPSEPQAGESAPQQPSERPDKSPENTQGSSSESLKTLLWTAGSIVLLIGGIVFAKLYK